MPDPPRDDVTPMRFQKAGRRPQEAGREDTVVFHGRRHPVDDIQQRPANAERADAAVLKPKTAHILKFRSATNAS